MNIALWILQVLLALHTVMGALWKFANPAEKAVPSLKAIPHAAWLGLSVVELFCAVALVLPFVSKSLALLAPIAAIVIALSMVLFCVVHLSSGNPFNGQVIYWIVVAAVCTFIAYGRLSLRPL